MRRSFLRAIAAIVLLLPLIAHASVSVTVNGSSHTIPQTNERGWGSAVTAWIQAISSYTLQPTGGTFTLTADTDFGANYGLKSIYYKSRASAPSSSGVFRLGNAEYMGWRNAGDSANYLLGVNSSNQLTFNGVVLASSTGPLFQDSLLTVFDNSDTTKLLQFQLSGITTGTTRTLTVPDANTTIVGTDATQTLTNKTISGNTATNLISGSGTLTLNTSGTATVPNATDTLVGKATTDTLTNKTLTSPAMTGPTVSSGVLTIPAGSAGAPSLTIASDTNTGLYSSAADKVELVGGGYAGIQVGKSTGNVANVGMGGSASSSDNYPLLIQRSNTSTGTYVQVSNPAADASSKATYQLASDVGANTGEISVFTAATTTDAYAGRMTVRASDSTAGLSLIAGDGASNSVRIYTGGTYTSAGNAFEVGSEKTVTLPQTIATASVSTPSSGLTLHNDGGVLKSKNSSGTARQYATLDGTETLTNKTVNGSSNTITNVSLTSGVTGTLPIANGGTNNGSLAVTAGGVIYSDGTKLMNVGAGTSGYVLQSNGASAPSWQASATSPDQSYELSNVGLAAAVAANALTISLKQYDGSSNCGAGASACKIGFRSSTATTGGYSQRSVTASLSTVISSGSTAGHMSATTHWIFVYAIDNAGTVELAWSSRMWDESTVQTTTAEGGAGAADSSTVLYSTTARTGVAIRLLGYITTNQTTAGTWATAPSKITLVPFDWNTLKPIGEFYHTGGTSISNNTYTTLEYDTVVTDNWSMSNAGSTTNWKAYIKVPGKYKISGQFAWVAAASGVRQLEIRQNNSVISYGQTSGNGSYAIPGTISDIIVCVTGDYITGVLYQDSGGAVAAHTGSRNNRLMIEWIGW